MERFKDACGEKKKLGDAIALAGACVINVRPRLFFPPSACLVVRLRSLVCCVFSLLAELLVPRAVRQTFSSALELFDGQATHLARADGKGDGVGGSGDESETALLTAVLRPELMRPGRTFYASKPLEAWEPLLSSTKVRVPVRVCVRVHDSGVSWSLSVCASCTPHPIQPTRS